MGILICCNSTEEFPTPHPPPYPPPTSLPQPSWRILPTCSAYTYCPNPFGLHLPPSRLILTKLCEVRGNRCRFDVQSFSGYILKTRHIKSARSTAATAVMSCGGMEGHINVTGASMHNCMLYLLSCIRACLPKYPSRRADRQGGGQAGRRQASR